jgi:S-adenosylmethionine:tRNA ribosyltransferase-isomerase
MHYEWFSIPAQTLEAIEETHRKGGRVIAVGTTSLRALESQAQTTLLMLVSAFAGVENIRKAYQHAIQNEYRFFSYGDAMFLSCLKNTHS